MVYGNQLVLGVCIGFLYVHCRLYSRGLSTVDIHFIVMPTYTLQISINGILINGIYIQVPVGKIKASSYLCIPFLKF